MPDEATGCGRSPVEALEEAVRAREEAIAMAAHDIRTPLTSLQLYLQLALRAADGGGPPDVSIPRLIDAALRQLERTIALLDRLLDVGRLSAGKLDLRLEQVDLGAVVAGVIDRFRPQIADAGCCCEARLAPDVRGLWDAVRLEQVAANLLSNALKHGGDGGLIEVEVARTGGGARLVVRDHGKGLPPGRAPCLFQPFERAGAGRNVPGVGLGLWICRRIVEALGGTIGVESVSGVGAAFTVDLPLAPPPLTSPGGSGL